MSVDYEERLLIRTYKKISKRLPKYDTLEEYWVPNFDPEEYSHECLIDGLSKYLKDLKKYISIVDSEAKLRQRHNELYIFK